MISHLRTTPIYELKIFTDPIFRIANVRIKEKVGTEMKPDELCRQRLEITFLLLIYVNGPIVCRSISKQPFVS